MLVNRESEQIAFSVKFETCLQWNVAACAQVIRTEWDRVAPRRSVDKKRVRDRQDITTCLARFPGFKLGGRRGQQPCSVLLKAPNHSKTCRRIASNIAK